MHGAISQLLHTLIKPKDNFSLHPHSAVSSSVLGPEAFLRISFPISTVLFPSFPRFEYDVSCVICNVQLRSSKRSRLVPKSGRHTFRLWCERGTQAAFSPRADPGWGRGEARNFHYKIVFKLCKSIFFSSL
jgi:hypothetical protein